MAIFTYNALNFDWWIKLLAVDVAATVVTFVFSVLFLNGSVYDPYWSVQPIVILAALAIGKALTPMRIMLLFAVCFWDIGLTLNWAYTFTDLSHQDWRYTMLREKTGAFYPIINFVGIHMVPTLVVWGCVLPAAYAFIFDVANTMLFLFVSIPLADGRQSAKPEFDKYKSETRMLLPIRKFR